MTPSRAPGLALSTLIQAPLSRLRQSYKAMQLSEETATTPGPAKKPRLYDGRFYVEQSAGSRRSAAAIAPLIFRMLNPRSIVDIGCGVGTWLAEFAALGVSDYLGIDGTYVPTGQLQIPPEKFLSTDLTKPHDLHRTYDLAMSLEVAEHLPADRAESFVAFLTAAAPVVLFSAAVPGQGGTGHVNEQWPQYWRKLFRRRGYVPVDSIRPLIWGNSEIDWWYQQNIFLYCERDVFAARSGFAPVPETRSLDIVHPALYELYSNSGFRGALGLAMKALVRRVSA